MEQKALIFGEDCINQNAFLKNKRPINIDEVDIGRIVLSKNIQIVTKVYLNTLLDIYMKVEFFQLHFT